MKRAILVVLALLTLAAPALAAPAGGAIGRAHDGRPFTLDSIQAP